MDLSIVIVSYNVRDMLRDCLRSLPAATQGLETEVFVVDNASQDRSAEMVAAEFPDVRLTASRDNLGFAGGNNLALPQCTGRHVLLLNPDTEAEPDSLARLVRFMDEHPKAGACGPKLLNTDGSLQASGTLFPSIKREALAATGLRHFMGDRFDRVYTFGRGDFDTTCETDVVTGACIMVRRSVMEQVGMLDERFFMFYEEVEWCHRIKQAGWQVWYVADVRVTHHWMGSVRQSSRKMTAELFKSSLLYYRKTAGPLTVAGAWAVMRLGILKNDLLHLGVAVKRVLRRLRVIR